MKRGQSPRRKTPLKRSTKRIKPRRGDPAKRRWASHRDVAFQEWVREQPCVLAGSPRRFECYGRMEACHVIARGAGGDDLGNLYPACSRHHRCQHLWGIKTFQEFFALDLGAIAKRLEREYMEFAA